MNPNDKNGLKAEASALTQSVAVLDGLAKSVATIPGPGSDIISKAITAQKDLLLKVTKLLEKTIDKS